MKKVTMSMRKSSGKRLYSNGELPENGALALKDIRCVFSIKYSCNPRLTTAMKAKNKEERAGLYIAPHRAHTACQRGASDAWCRGRPLSTPRRLASRRRWSARPARLILYQNAESHVVSEIVVNFRLDTSRLNKFVEAASRVLSLARQAGLDSAEIESVKTAVRECLSPIDVEME
jgi:hypothetical protein